MASLAAATIAGNMLTASWIAADTFGSAAITGARQLPALPGIGLLDGTGVGQISRVGIASGTLTNGTPGTTDTALLDLKNLVDLNGKPFTDLAKLVSILVLNDSPTAGNVLLLGNSGTNDFADIFNGTATSVLKVGPGYADPVTNGNVPGFAFLFCGALAGYTVDATHKIVKVYSGSAVSLPYRVVVLGRH
jgi:hypothetical protein